MAWSDDGTKDGAKVFSRVWGCSGVGESRRSLIRLAVAAALDLG